MHAHLHYSYPCDPRARQVNNILQLVNKILLIIHVITIIYEREPKENTIKHHYDT